MRASYTALNVLAALLYSMCAWMVDSYGSSSQRKNYIPDLTSMNKFSSYCLTEPGAGSDAANLQTRALLHGDTYHLTGSKVSQCVRGGVGLIEL